MVDLQDAVPTEDVAAAGLQPQLGLPEADAAVHADSPRSPGSLDGVK